MKTQLRICEQPSQAFPGKGCTTCMCQDKLWLEVECTANPGSCPPGYQKKQISIPPREVYFQLKDLRFLQRQCSVECGPKKVITKTSRQEGTMNQIQIAPTL